MGKLENNTDVKDDISTNDFINTIARNIKANKSSLLKLGDDPSEDETLLDACVNGLEYVGENFLNIIGENDDLKAWTAFLLRWEPKFSNYQDFVKNGFLVLAIIEIIQEEVAILGGDESLPYKVHVALNESQEFYEDGYKADYNRCKKAYEKVLKFVLLEERAFERFKRNNELSIKSELNDLRLEKESFEKEFNDCNLKIRAEIIDNKEVLSELKNETGFTALYNGFERYTDEINIKIRNLNIEKIFWMVLIGLVIARGVYSNSFNEENWISIIPLAGAVLLFSTMLRVNLKKLDQYEQVLSKVKHKLAVSTFYQSELRETMDDSKAQSINDEYYRFLFTEIETTEWSTPDMVSDVSNILKSYKKP